MKVVIIGGGGFIGSALVKHLSGWHRCVCYGHGGRFGELKQLVGGGVEFVEGGLEDGALLREVLGGADAVAHVAGMGGEADCLADPVRALLTHVSGTHVLLREALRARVARFMFASTIAVYGTYKSRPMPLEEEAGASPDDFYGALKATAEAEVVDSGSFQVFRLSNVYGAGALAPASGSVADKFIEAAAAGRPLKLFGGGAQLIDYVNVGDVCRAFALALAAPPRNFVYNVGGGIPVSIRELAGAVRRVASERFGLDVSVEEVPAPPQKVWPDRWLSISKMRDELGWRPLVGLEEGLAEMLALRLGRTGQSPEQV